MTSNTFAVTIVVIEVFDDCENGKFWRNRCDSVIRINALVKNQGAPGIEPFKL